MSRAYTPTPTLHTYTTGNVFFGNIVRVSDRLQPFLRHTPTDSDSNDSNDSSEGEENGPEGLPEGLVIDCALLTTMDFSAVSVRDR